MTIAHTSFIKPALLFVLLICSKIFLAQTGIEPVMKISNPGTKHYDPMQLEELKVDVKVIGQIAVTTLEMTYYNANDRIMEGEFNFPLGEGQTVSRFALDINGQMREGVVVEKEKGRKTFEAVVRKNVDPGLMEMTTGNNFRARVYPLPAKGIRKIIIAFEQELSDKGNYDLYLLPLNISQKVKLFSLHIEVFKKPVEFNCDENEFEDILLKKWNESYVSDAIYTDFQPKKQIALNFPNVDGAKNIYTAMKNDSRDSSYFYVNIKPKVFETKKVLPSILSIFWDNSSSSADRNFEKEYSILEAYLREIGNVKVELIPFNILPEKAQIFTISNGNSNELLTFLKNMTYDGATSLAKLNFSNCIGEEILLFSDGISNFGTGDLQSSKVPLMTINSKLIADHSSLLFLAQNSGGSYINLNKLTHEEALNLLLNTNYHFISAEISSGDVSEIYPRSPAQFNSNFSLSGIIKGKTASLTLNFGYGKTIANSEQITIHTDNMSDPEILRRIWAVKKIHELSFNEEKNKNEILATAQTHSVVSKNTSLIVLDRLEDYVEHRITPPKEMRFEYDQIVQKMDRDSIETRDTKLKLQIEKVVTLSNEQSKWWNTKFSLLPEKKVYTEKSLENNGRAGSNRDVQTSDAMGVESEAVLEFIEIEPNSRESGMLNIKNKDTEAATKAEIQLNAWDPQTPYYKVLQYATKGQEYQTYMKLKTEYGTTPSFYIDASGFFAKLGKKDTAVKIISNLAELNLESPQLLRILGTKLLDLKQHPEAVQVFEAVLKIKGEEPQSYRDLGNAYEANGETQKAIETLYKAVTRSWDARFPGIELIIMNEINAILNKNSKIDYSFIDKRLVKNEPVDLRVVLSWDTDNCDMDLWVTDPYGEKCYYSHQLTHIGGKMTKDFTGGYGPEEFMAKIAKSGTYTVQANYYGTRSQAVLAPVNLHLEFITNFGKVNEKRQQVTIRLDNAKDVIDVGKFVFSAN